MKKSLLSILLCLFTFFSFCQQSDTIVIVKTFDNLTFLKDGKAHKLNELSNLVATNPEAVRYADKARTNNTFALIFSCAGGFMIGWPLGTYMGGGDAEWGLLAVGVGSFTVGMIINSSTKKNAQKAVELYNAGLKAPTSDRAAPQLNIGCTRNGVGLTLNF